MKGLLTVLYLLLAAWGFSQTTPCNITLTGRVIDDHDESPLSFSHILIHGTGRVTVADENGEFTVTEICPGRYQVEVSHVGCEPIQRDIVVSSKSDQYLLFRMEHHHHLREVEVAARTHESKAHVNTQSFQNEELNLIRMQSLSEAVSVANGVSVLKSGPNLTKPMIQGVYGNRVAIYNQSAKVEDQQWGADHAPALELSDAGMVSVVKGPQGLEFGPEAVGGAIVVLPAPFESQRKLSGRIQSGFFTNGRGAFANASVSGVLLNTKRLHYRFSGGWNQSGDRHTPEYNLQNTGNRHYNFSGGLRYQYKTFQIKVDQSVSNQSYGIYTEAHNSSLLDLQGAVDRGQPLNETSFNYAIENPRQLVEHYTTQVSASVKPGDKSQLEFIYTHQYNHRREFDLRRGPLFETPVVDLRLRTHSARLKYTQVLNGGWSFKTGAEGRMITNVSSHDTGTRPIIPNYQQFQYGVFTTFTKWLETWELEAGVRYDFTEINAFKWYKSAVWNNQYMPEFADFVVPQTLSEAQVYTEPTFGFHNLSAAVSATKTWSEKFQTGLRGALVTRPPNSPELFSDGLHLGSATIEYGNLGLSPERAISAEVFGEYNSSQIRISAAGYAQFYNGFILPEFNGLELTVRGAFPRMAYSQTTALFYGVNWRGEWKFHRQFSLNHQAALTYADDLDREGYLLFIPPPEMRNEIKWTPINESDHRLEFSVGVRSHFRQNRAPKVITPEALRNMTAAEVTENLASGSFDIAPPPGEYHLLYARIFASFPWKTREVQIGITGDNLLNRSYRDYLNRFRYYALDTGINIQFMCNLKF